MTERVVVVTGGATGIGHGIAKHFKANGAWVAILGRRAELLTEAAEALTKDVPEGHVEAFPCDITNPGDVARLVDWLQAEERTQVDVLVNNAGGLGAGGVAPPQDISEAARFASDVIASNLLGAFLVGHALRPLLARPGGRIVNISSLAAHRGGGELYSAAKAGVIGLTYAWANQLGPDGITVNAISPGIVVTPELAQQPGIPERFVDAVAQTPVRRTGVVEDIAAAVAYLASPDASYVTGQVLHVNGGVIFGR
jgi:3-oxoacyl-[acyl-carrier protein] reductase